MLAGGSEMRKEEGEEEGEERNNSVFFCITEKLDYIQAKPRWEDEREKGRPNLTLTLLPF
jgi:hypothetical protein